jgi:hypothetical protein
MNFVGVSLKRAVSVITISLSTIGAIAAAAEPAGELQILLDQARIIRLPDQVSTLVIGNPAVADGTLQTGGLLVVTGKSFGTTNIIALDQRGNVLSEHAVTVAAPKQETLTVWRGAKRETWSCAPRCETSVMLGDNPDFFESAVGQVQTRNSFAAGQAIAPSK